MTLNEAISQLETLDKYLIDKDYEALGIALDALKKYQKIETIVKKERMINEPEST